MLISCMACAIQYFLVFYEVVRCLLSEAITA